MLHPMRDEWMLRYGHDRMLQIAAQRRLVRAAQAARRTPALSAPRPALLPTVAWSAREDAPFSARARAHLHVLRWLYRTGCLAP
jgi:hypothetical protein